MRHCADADCGKRDDYPSMFGSTYAVSWDEAGGNRCAGRLDFDRGALILTGAWNGCRTSESIPLGEIKEVSLEGGRLCVTQRNGDTLSIRSLDAPGVLRELAERIAACA